MRDSVSRAAGLACAGICAGLLYVSGRFLFASIGAIEDTRETVTQAIVWTPGDARLHERHAGLWRDSDRRDDITLRLKAAVRLNPRLTSARLALAQELENAGEAGGAERVLLETVRLDRQFDPRWALANFYFRQGNRSQFQQWLVAASGMAFDGRPLFALAMQAGLTPRFAAERMVQGRLGLARSLLSYATDARAADWAVAAAPPVLAGATADDRDLLLSTVEMLLSADRIDAASQLWNGLVDRNAIPFAKTAPGNVTNASFTIPITGTGFDWRRLPAPGVSIRPGAGLQLDFSSTEVPACDLVSQVVQVRPGSSLQFDSVNGSSDNDDPRGFYWTILTWPRLRPITTLELRPGQGARRDSTRFIVPPDIQAIRLLLSYRRPAGFSRFRGKLTIESVSLK